MTQEEKAKRYDEALEMARKLYESYNRLVLSTDEIERIFPELAESEDEKIREEMIRYFTEMKKGGSVALPYDDCIAYLERQKEKGRNITANLLEDGITGVQRELIEFLANNIDASWVDVIKSSDAYAQRIRLMVEKQKEPQHAIRATKGFGDPDGPQFELVDIQEEQKPAEWSEEDEAALCDLMWCIKQARDSAKDENDMGNIWSAEHWLKNRLKSIRPQPKRKWTLSDEKLLGDVMVAVELDKFFTDEYQKKIASWLRSLRPYPQSQWKPSEEQIKAVEHAYNSFPNDCPTKSNLRRLSFDLKKLR